jgi:hypothetical protein
VGHSLLQPRFHGFRLTTPRPHRLLPSPDPNVAPSSLWHHHSPIELPIRCSPNLTTNLRLVALRHGVLCTQSSVFGLFVEAVFWNLIVQIALTTWSRSNQTPCRVTKATRPRRPLDPGSSCLRARWSLTTACQRLDDLFLPATATTYRPIAHQHALHDPSPSDHMPVSLKHIYHAPLWQDQLIFPPIRS